MNISNDYLDMISLPNLYLPFYNQNCMDGAFDDVIYLFGALINFFSVNTQYVEKFQFQRRLNDRSMRLISIDITWTTHIHVYVAVMSVNLRIMLVTVSESTMYFLDYSGKVVYIVQVQVLLRIQRDPPFSNLQECLEMQYMMSNYDNESK